MADIEKWINLIATLLGNIVIFVYFITKFMSPRIDRVIDRLDRFLTNMEELAKESKSQTEKLDLLISNPKEKD